MSFATSPMPPPPSPRRGGASATHRPANKRVRSDASAHSRDSSSGSSNSKKVKVVTQACQDCRRNKSKCDGIRPKCGPCVSKGRQCGYEGEVGQSRPAAKKSRLETLEKLFDTLQTRPAEDAERLLRQIRAKDGLSSALQCLEAGDDDHQSRSSPDDRSSSASRPPCGRTCLHQGFGCADELMPTMSSASSLSSFSMSPLWSKERSRASALVYPDLPSRELTARALDAFYISTGQLFHVFSRAQTATFLDEIYRADQLTSRVSKALCSVACVAAIGIQYRDEDFDSRLDTTYYDIARRSFLVVLEDRQLDSIKVYAMFAMYNILNKATASVAYIEAGLGMFPKHSLSHKPFYAYAGSTPEDDKEYRVAWRCLIFFSTWLSTTLGYISNEDVPLSTLLALAEAEDGASADIVETVQVEMTKISILKAEILRLHLASRDLTDVAVESTVVELQEWHDRLPPRMALATLGESDLPDSVRRSIYYVHLLYLGAVMLLYRRVASQFDRTKAATATDDALRRRFEHLMLDQAEHGVMAAKTSSRILNLLLGQVGCFKRCWVIIFQSYTSCIVLLHTVAQKQVHNLPPSSWEEEDLPQAKTCLLALEYCSTLDPVALKFHDRLAPIYAALTKHRSPSPLTSSSYPTPRSPIPVLPNQHQHPDDPQSGHPLAYLFTIPSAGDPVSVALSRGLLRTLSRPYDNPSCGNGERIGLEESQKPPPPRGGEVDEMDGDGVEWERRNVWQKSRLGILEGLCSGLGVGVGEDGRGAVGVPGGGGGHKMLARGGRWLGSETPSGWREEI